MPAACLVVAVLGVGLLLGVALGLLAVDEVEALGFDQAVDACTDDTSEDLLGLRVVLGITVLGLVVVVGWRENDTSQRAVPRSHQASWLASGHTAAGAAKGCGCAGGRHVCDVPLAAS